MATRPDSNLQYTTKVIRIVETGQTVAVGNIVKDGNADKECQKAGAGDLGFGVVLAIGGNTQVTAGAALDKVTVGLLDVGIIPVLVGTGGATRGAQAKAVSNGVTDATHAPAGATSVGVHGIFTQSGVAADLVGMLPAPGLIIET